MATQYYVNRVPEVIPTNRPAIAEPKPEYRNDKPAPRTAATR